MPVPEKQPKKKPEEMTTDEVVNVLFPPDMAKALREEIEAHDKPVRENKEPIEEYDA